MKTYRCIKEFWIDDEYLIQKLSLWNVYLSCYDKIGDEELFAINKDNKNIITMMYKDLKEHFEEV